MRNAGDNTRKSEPKEAKITLSDGFKVKSTDGEFQAQVGMYVQADAAWYGESDTDFSDGTELRRGRLSLSGTFFKDWDYKKSLPISHRINKHGLSKLSKEWQS